MRTFPPLDHPLVFEQPRRLTDVDSWHEHIPFAFFAIAALRPRVVVELGTWKGDSYCALCQAVQALSLPSRCYAVDTWTGDEHTGWYDTDVLDELRAYHDPLYGSFSTLLQTTFDAAAPSFADGTIDLLHVDGCHSYDAVAHDVETWLPKLSDRGVLLLHDTNVRDVGFGVWRLWDELLPRYRGFAFTHGHGLGVLAVGSDIGGEFLELVERADADGVTSAFFAALGSRIAAPARARRERTAIEALAAQQVESAHHELERVRAEADQSSAEARTALEDAARRAAAAETATARVARRLEESEEALARSGADLTRALDESERLRLERDRSEQQVFERERDLTGVIESQSWRLTAPLRAAKRGPARARVLMRRAARMRQARFSAQDGPRIERSLSRVAPGPSAEELTFRPLVSIVTPVYDVDPAWLGRAVDSVREQSYPDWQLCLADDGSTSEATLTALRGLGGDPKVTITYSDTNTGIAAATNRALGSAEGEYVAFLDHDDELHPDALLACVRVLNAKPETDVVYTDEDKIDRRGRPSEPFFKPDWSPEYFRGVMYVGHLLMIRRSLVEEVGGPDSSFDGVQDYELMLRVSERTERIEHVPQVLYHWRKHPGSLAASTDAKDGIARLQASAVAAHLGRCRIPAVARPHPSLPHRAVLAPAPRAAWPEVTVIVPTRDAPAQLERCLGSIFERSSYPRYRVRLIDNRTTDPDALRLFDRYPVDVVPFDEPFNFSRANNLGVAGVSSEVVIFLNNDTEVRSPDWLEVLVDLLERVRVGAVGPLLVYPDGTVQHAGVVLGLRGTADHILRGAPSATDGYAGSLSCTREVSAVTGACMAIRRDVFLELGGFDEHFATHYQDVDLCLRLGATGRRNLFTPRVVVGHDESVTRGDGYDHLDRALLLDRWGMTIERGDPYYNPQLSLAGADYRPRSAA